MKAKEIDYGQYEFLANAGKGKAVASREGANVTRSAPHYGINSLIRRQTVVGNANQIVCEGMLDEGERE